LVFIQAFNSDFGIVSSFGSVLLSIVFICSVVFTLGKVGLFSVASLLLSISTTTGGFFFVSSLG